MSRPGDRFGRLVLVSAVRVGRGARWRCQCDCGRAVEVRQDSLHSGETRSCGCLVTDAMRRRAVKHGRSHTREYQAWRNARARCSNPKVQMFAYYGGRGITMCARWRDSFEAFLADMGPCPAGLTLERIENDGHYEPSNCRWATRAEQRQNQRKSRRLSK